MNLSNQSQLGKKTIYPSKYNPNLLLSIERRINRQAHHINEPLPFYGYDQWNAYELSWLNKKGKPIVAIGKFIIPCTSSHLIESKSFKLYLNSFNHECFSDQNEATTMIARDLSRCVGETVAVKLYHLTEQAPVTISPAPGICLDKLDIEIKDYQVNPSLLAIGSNTVTETLHSHLLKSNCPVTQQPDWGTVQISYSGQQIDHAGLLQYIISYRNHNDFHETCVERMFMDIKQRCQPHTLTVRTNYTRRGGLDINPFRSSEPVHQTSTKRLARQ